MDYIREYLSEEQKEDSIFTPCDPGLFDERTVIQFLHNLEIEIDSHLFNDSELLLLSSALYGKYLDLSQRPFFLYHFIPLWIDAIQFLFKGGVRPTIVELGCGTGTSSLLFGLLGANVIGIEMNPDLVGICNKRKKFYNERCRLDLNVSFFEANTFSFPYEAYSPVDAFFSLFAFNLMKPAELLIKKMVPALAKGGLILVIDGNSRSVYGRILPSRRRPGVLSPTMMQKAMERHGLRVSNMVTHCAVPPFMFKYPRICNSALVIEKLLHSTRLHAFAGVSYSILGRRINA